MKIPEKGLSREDILKSLEEYRTRDIAWREGRTFGYVYDAGKEAESICKEAYGRYLTENGLDPTVFPSLLRLENEIVSMAKAHLGGNDDGAGNFTSGGTESILLCVKTARDWAREKKPQIQHPEMILPVTAHAAFHKAAHYLCVKPVFIPVDPLTYKADIEALKKAITENTILLVGSAASYAHGVVDPIEEMGKIALERNLLLHVDGCIGGFILPYFKRLGETIPAFDFSVPGVTSISMDLHKYAYAAKGASVILYKSKEMRKYQIFCCSAWTGYSVINTTIQSSKSGGPMAGAWAVLHSLGEEGYLKIAGELLRGMKKILQTIGEMKDLYVLGKPEMCLIAVASNTVNIFNVIDEMKGKGWYIQPQLAFAGCKENFHLTLHPSTLPHLDQMLSDLKECVETAKKIPPQEMAVEAIRGMNLESMEDKDLLDLLALSGIEDTSLPTRMALIQEILNTLSPELKNRMLRAFCNKLFA